MREFRAYMWVDGDLTVYIRNEGESDSAWVLAGRVKFEDRFGAKGGVEPTAQKLGLTPLKGPERDRLNQELAYPREW